MAWKPFSCLPYGNEKKQENPSQKKVPPWSPVTEECIYYVIKITESAISLQISPSLCYSRMKEEAEFYADCSLIPYFKNCIINKRKVKTCKQTFVEQHQAVVKCWFSIFTIGLSLRNSSQLRKMKHKAQKVVSFWCSEAELYTQVEGKIAISMFETLPVQTLFLLWV